MGRAGYGPVVEVVPFTDQYEAVAQLHGVSAESLRERESGREIYRWLSLAHDGTVVGSLTGYHRPDDRWFLRLIGEGREPLVGAAQADLKTPVYVSVHISEVEAYAAIGFETEMAQEAFRLRFEDVLPRLRKGTLPAGFALQAADAVDEERLFELDNHIRNDMPGTDGWRGDRAMFHDELRDVPVFDPAGYLVAIHLASEDYAGLIRMWRNPSEPRLGAIGVHRDYRRTRIGAALLRTALKAASEWGSETFTSETSLSNAVIYPRLSQGLSLGVTHQMVRRTS